MNTASEEYPRWSPAGEDFGGPVVMDDAFAAHLSADRLSYFAVADVGTAAATAQEAGGELLMPPTSVPAGQRIAVVRDPRGAVLGIHRTGDQG
ncbi:VOC family protein [Streptomyces sp. CB01580]|uniref:VOC family protein n=1 Tax=Streptomyces sp. CB01580 TaxID=1703933 RepID=UPI00093BA9FB|nr:VOC family protein [Streptomyces sp. CB01580]